MKRFNYTSSFLIPLVLIIGVVVMACNRAEELPVEPVITSLSFDTQSEALKLEFTDGDGDFGIGPDYDEPPFLDPDSTIVNPYYTNLWIDYYEKREGEWVLVETPDSFNFRVPVLTPEGQNKQLEVKITYDMSFELPFPTAQSDTIKFRVTLVDRARHESVPKETEAIYLPN